MVISQNMGTTRQQQITEAVKQYSRKLFGFVRKRVATDEDAEDLVQDVFQQMIITSLNEPIEQVSAWLYRVAGNKVIDWYRKKKPVPLENFAVKTEEDELILPEFLFADKGGLPDDIMNRQIFWDMLHDSLKELPEEQREVFVMHELEGLSFKQIEKLTGAKQNTLLSRKRYAVVHLRKRLQEFYSEFFN
ncbi:MAG: RNA polymerase sigma factor [Bacteroidota bacterium]